MTFRHVADLGDEAFVKFYLEFQADMERRQRTQPDSLQEVIRKEAGNTPKLLFHAMGVNIFWLPSGKLNIALRNIMLEELVIDHALCERVRVSSSNVSAMLTTNNVINAVTVTDTWVGDHTFYGNHLHSA